MLVDEGGLLGFSQYILVLYSSGLEDIFEKQEDN
jgi:hypothetical protein